MEKLLSKYYTLKNEDIINNGTHKDGSQFVSVKIGDYILSSELSLFKRLNEEEVEFRLKLVRQDGLLKTFSLFNTLSRDYEVFEVNDLAQLLETNGFKGTDKQIWQYNYAFLRWTIRGRFMGLQPQ